MKKYIVYAINKTTKQHQEITIEASDVKKASWLVNTIHKELHPVTIFDETKKEVLWENRKGRESTRKLVMTIAKNNRFKLDQSARKLKLYRVMNVDCLNDLVILGDRFNQSRDYMNIGIEIVRDQLIQKSGIFDELLKGTGFTLTNNGDKIIISHNKNIVGLPNEIVLHPVEVW